jgi:hypothetical protein
MKKIIIIIVSLFLLLSAVNFGTSKPIITEDSETDYSFDNSIVDNIQEQQILQNINRLDGFFTENRGQVGNDSVRYYIQGKGVWFLDDSVVFEIRESINENEVQRDPYDSFNPEVEPEIPKPRKSVVLRLNFEGCNEVEPKGIEQLPHRNNYFYGNDSSKWCTNVPNYQELIYENIYDNIDLRYYSTDRGLKYDFIVRPGGDPSSIILNYQGAKDLKLDEKNNLIIQTSLGKIVDSELFIYQNINNYNNKIEGNFKIIKLWTCGFEIKGEYDYHNDLIIDPLVYSTFIGGTEPFAYDSSGDIAIDQIGNAYVVGGTNSASFPTTPGAYNTVLNGTSDAYILKLNPSGSSLLYSTFIGGSYEESAHEIEIDEYGNAIIVGFTKSSGFPTTLGTYDNSYNGEKDIYLLKLNLTGSNLLYSTFIGGSDDEDGYNMVIDINCSAYITGYTRSTDFPTTSGSFDETFQGGLSDAFILKFNFSSPTLSYSTFVGSGASDQGIDIKVDHNGNAIVTGSAGDDPANKFPTTPGTYDTTHNHNTDVFLLKLNQTGSGIIFSTLVGGSSFDNGISLAIDSYSNYYIAGWTASIDFPTTPNAYNTTYDSNEFFIIKLNSNCSSLLFSTFVGGSNVDGKYAKIILDNSGNPTIMGTTESLDFPTTLNGYDTSFNGGTTDVVFFKLNSNGSSLLYSSYLGGSLEDYVTGLKIDTYGNLYITGITKSSDFPMTQNSYDTDHNGYHDVYILKFSFNNFPIVIDCKISESNIFRTNSIFLFINGTDVEDIEKNLTPYFEYRDLNEQAWNTTYFTIPTYQNSRWKISFTPPKNATLGLYDFRVRFNDTGQLFSNWIYLNDSLLVLNNLPEIDDILISDNIALLRDSISIWVNASDIEEIEKNLTLELEYRDPSETFWEKNYLSASNYIDSRWEYSFNTQFDALFGYYDFRVRCNDSDGNYSEWHYLNDSLLIYNTGPKVIDAGLSEASIYRTESVLLFINGTDYETPENMLKFFSQYKSDIKNEWINLTGGYIIDRWETDFTTDIDTKLGFYDFRVSFEDNESVSSGWVYLNDSFEVLNNLPTISEDLDDISVGIQPLIIDLSPFESDIEDTNENLIWGIEPQIYTYIESIEIIDTINDTLKITPKENVTGTEDIELTLTDKDSGTAVKSDITINIDSTISEFTPKVTLLSPVNKAVINTLTPILKWELDYAGTETITYTVKLDENPDPQTTIITDLSATEYTLENELVDDKTYYWTVEPANGICLSGVYRFTINLGFEPVYKVNLTAEIESATIKQGASKDINLTVTNEGNSVDNFKIEFSSANLLSYISIDKTNVALDPEINSKVKLSIDIPDDFTTWDYEVTVTATSLTDLTAKDEITIDVKVVSKDFVPDYDASISISPTSLELEQGDSDNVSITITNNGNIEDDFTVNFESTDFTSANIQFSDTSVSIADGDSDTITVTIKIPEDMEPGVYTVKFIVESTGDPQESTLTITVKDKDGEEPGDKKDDEDNTMLYALIGIIIVIIVVLILLFIFLKKKKGEEEPSVEEVQPEPPEEVPPEVPPEQVPVPETPPTEQPQVPEVQQEQPPPTPEVTPQEPQSQVEPTPEPIPQVEEQSVPQPSKSP